MAANFERAMRFLQSGTYQPGTMEVRHWDYYDSAILATGTNNYQFFMVPEGQGGKNRSRTNFPLAGQMPESERMAVMYLEFAFIPDELVAQATWIPFTDILKHSYIEFTIQNKSPMLILPLHSCFGAALPALVTGAAAGDQLIPRDGVRACYELDIEIPLAAKTTFKIEWIFDTTPNTALDDYKLYIHMVGPRYSF